jgi:hypothetical protein
MRASIHRMENLGDMLLFKQMHGHTDVPFRHRLGIPHLMLAHACMRSQRGLDY